MPDMGETVRVKLVDVSKAAGRNKGWTISGVSVFVIVAFLFNFGGRVLDVIVTNAPAYKTMSMRVNKAETELRHNRHLVESQNFILLTMFRKGLITIEQYTSRVHAVDHRRDSL